MQSNTRVCLGVCAMYHVSLSLSVCILYYGSLSECLCNVSCEAVRGCFFFFFFSNVICESVRVFV